MALEGVSRDEAARILATRPTDPKETEPVEILATLQPVLELVLDCLNHVRVASMGLGGAAVLGFDWPIFEQVARWKGIEIDAELFADLREFEREMIRHVNALKGAPS